jgi:SAM-dependent MidA family methyltransferase
MEDFSILGAMHENDTGMSTQGEQVLSPAEARHCNSVRAHVEAEIAAAGGWLSFERYMDIVLYAPGLGYYSAGARKFGGDGDFTTAPELSGLFGACVAQQCAQLLDAIPAASILEIGAGSGRLAADILLRLETLGRLPAQYRILEVSADLRERQRRHLQRRAPHLLDRLCWLNAPPAERFSGVILANEVLDALPVARFRWRRAQTEELGVTLEAGELAFAARPASRSMTDRCALLAAAASDPWEEGYTSEYCPRLESWTRSVTDSLHTGAVLWFDYGLQRPQYYFAQRNDGTLLCHFRQRAHSDPLLFPGLQDITAWVDFTALAEACLSAGCDLAGFATQAYFLAAAGIDGEMRVAAGDDATQFALLANQARQLMLPGEMGERFKAMAWLRNLDLELSGFALQDLRHTL